MDLLIDIGLFALGFVLGIFWFSVIVLPIFYGFPRALIWAGRGWLKWRASFTYLVVPIVWTATLFVVAYIIDYFFPDAAEFLMKSAPFGWGQTAGILLSLVRAIFSRSTRADMSIDFLTFAQPHLTDTGEAALFEEPEA